MSEASIFQDWKAEHSRLRRRVPFKLRHGLANDPLFSDAALARLIERYPRQHYQLMQPASDPNASSRDGDVTGVPGEAVLAAIAKGRMWINLRQVAEVDPRYAALAVRIFAEIGAAVPGFSTLSRAIGTLVSSPRAQTDTTPTCPVRRSGRSAAASGCSFTRPPNPSCRASRSSASPSRAANSSATRAGTTTMPR